MASLLRPPPPEHTWILQSKRENATPKRGSGGGGGRKEGLGSRGASWGYSGKHRGEAVRQVSTQRESRGASAVLAVPFLRHQPGQHSLRVPRDASSIDVSIDTATLT